MNPGNGIETVDSQHLPASPIDHFLLMNPGNGIETAIPRLSRHRGQLFPINESRQRDWNMSRLTQLS